MPADKTYFIQDVEVRKDGHVVVVGTAFLSKRKDSFSGVTSWDGLLGVGEDLALTLDGGLEIRMRDGQVGTCFVGGEGAGPANVSVRGSGPPPF